jgi:hypothetical protein
LKSIGERKLIEYLTARKIVYAHNRCFQDCRSLPTEKRPSGVALRFDFLIYDAKKVVGAIEYDGQSHFNPHYFHRGIGNFERVVANDKTKDDYCREKGIPLLRIKYTEFDRLEEITDEFLDSIKAKQL